MLKRWMDSSVGAVRTEYRMIDIKIKQLYSYHKDPKDPLISFSEKRNRDALIISFGIIFEITKIDGFIGVTSLKDETGWFKIGAEYIAKHDDIINSGNYRLIWDPSMEVTSTESVTKYGIKCLRCNKYYPHAEKTNNFKCWACRNGF